MPVSLLLPYQRLQRNALRAKRREIVVEVRVEGGLVRKRALSHSVRVVHDWDFCVLPHVRAHREVAVHVGVCVEARLEVHILVLTGRATLHRHGTEHRLRLVQVWVVRGQTIDLLRQLVSVRHRVRVQRGERAVLSEPSIIVTA